MCVNIVWPHKWLGGLVRFRDWPVRQVAHLGLGVGIVGTDWTE